MTYERSDLMVNFQKVWHDSWLEEAIGEMAAVQKQGISNFKLGRTG